MFIDASAIVAMLAQEPDAPDLAERFDKAKKLITSPSRRRRAPWSG